MTSHVAKAAISEEDTMRASLYGLLGSLLFVAPSTDTLNSMQDLSGDETEMGNAFDTLAKLSTATDVKTALDEYNGLFIGMGRGELLPYASYYLTGFLNEKPLAKLRNTMQELNIARSDETKEPEDHIGSLFQMMAGLITGSYGAPAMIAVQRDFFDTHIEPWASHFFKDLEAAELSRLYQPVGTIGRLFVGIETDAFSME
ncbi:MAG: molecular chaperone TorD family protein [Rhizobiaceae bacterium]